MVGTSDMHSYIANRTLTVATVVDCLGNKMSAMFFGVFLLFFSTLIDEDDFLDLKCLLPAEIIISAEIWSMKIEILKQYNSHSIVTKTSKKNN